MNECDTLMTIPALFNTNSALKQLRLEFMQSLTNMDGVAGLPNLDFFFIRALPNCTTLPKDLSLCSSLSVICIETPVKDISPIHDLVQLKHLRIMYSLDSLPESLFTNPNLEKLEIAQSRIVDASALERFTELKELRLSHNPEMNVYPDLTKFPKLELSFIDGKISTHHSK